MSIIQKALIQAQKNQIKSFDHEAFQRNQLLLFFFADRIDRKATDLISQMKQVGIYRFDDKKAIDTIKFNASNLVADLDKACTEDYACTFGEMADELDSIIYEYLSNKKTLQHSKASNIAESGKV